MRTAVQRDLVALTGDALQLNARLLLAECPSGFLPPHRTSNGGVGYIKEIADQLYSGGSGDTAIRLEADTTIYVPGLGTVQSGDANKAYLKDEAAKICVNGYMITLDSRITKRTNTIIEMPASPSTGTRQDLVMIEVWRESVTSGVSDDCFFPFGNVFYDPYNDESTFDGCTLVSTDQTGGNWPLYLAAAAGGYGPEAGGANSHGKYVVANDANINDFVNNPANNVGITPDGNYYQIRYRIVTLQSIDPTIMTSIRNSDIKDASGNWFAPQGAFATRPAVGAAKTDADGVFVSQSGETNHESTVDDSGLYVGGTYTNDNTKLTSVSGLSDDGFSYAIPLFVINRRNQTAWALDNVNGAGAIGGSSGRPDGKFYDCISDTDILDLRHRVDPAGFDLEEVFNESNQSLLKAELNTKWEMLKEDSDGNDTFADLDIWSPRPLRIEGIAASAFDSSWDVIRRATCNNGISANPDGFRSYFSDEAGEQALFGYIANEGSDGALPSGVFSYVASTHVLTCAATALSANDGAHADRPQWGNVPIELYWSGASNNSDNKTAKAWVTHSASSGDSINVTINQETYCQMDTTVSGVGQGDEYQSPNAVNVIIDGSPDASNRYSGYFTGSTIPNTGTWTRILGTGPITINVTVVRPGAKYMTWGAGGDKRIYVGEGYDLHSGERLFINAYLEYKPGSGFISRVPYDSKDGYYGISGIKASRMYVGGTDQIIPNNGIDFHPFTSCIFPEHSRVVTDTHTRNTSLAGFAKKGLAVSCGDGGAQSVRYMADCSVINDSGTFKMWYNARDASNNGRIFYCDSSDGLSWSNHQKVVDLGNVTGEDEILIGSVSVIKDGSTYRMWYSARGTTNNYDKILYCDSSNGTTWSNHQKVIDKGSHGSADSTGTSSPCVIKDGSTFKMWYSGRTTGESKIIYATSSNGTSWSNFTLLFNQNDVDERTYYGQGSMSVIKDGSVYKAWISDRVYGAAGIYRRAIYYTRSIDGIHWSGPVCFLTEGRLEGRAETDLYLAPSIIKVDKAYWMFQAVNNLNIDGASGVSVSILSMVDTSNTGSSTVGVYSTGGTPNFAPGATDEVLVFYESLAQQQDWGRFNGSSPNISLDYVLKYLSPKMVASTLGTGGYANDDSEDNGEALRYDYRDFNATVHNAENLFERENGQTLSNLSMIASITQDEAFAEVPYSFDHDENNVHIGAYKPKAGDVVSLSDLTDLSGTFGGGGGKFAVWDTEYKQKTFGEMRPRIGSLDGHAPNLFVGAIGEKNKELFMPAALGRSFICRWIQSYNLIGRPIVK